jgi:hypothetical protein
MTMGEMTKIRAFDEDAQFGAYVAKPAGAAKAAIIVIPEIFGVNPGIRQKCDKWAEARLSGGRHRHFLALCTRCRARSRCRGAVAGSFRLFRAI